MSILARFVLLTLGLMVLSAGAITTVGIRSQREALREQAVKRGQTLTRQLALASADALLTRDPLTLVNLAVDTQAQDKLVAYAALVDKTGRVAGHSDRRAMGRAFNLIDAEPMPGAGEGLQQAMFESQVIWDISMPIVPKGFSQAVGEAHVAIFEAPVLASIREGIIKQLVAAGLLMALGGILTFAFVGVLVRPLRALADAAKQVGEGRFGIQVSMPGSGEIGQLIARFNQMSANLEQASRERLDKERMQGELNVARKIQQDLLPDEAPKLKGWELAFHCTPAKELGGDFYDWFPLDGGQKLGLVIADVSGKGVPAALHMANLRNLMRFAAQAGKGPGATLKAVNAQAFPDLKGESFVTVLYIEIDLRSRNGILATAGHDPALILDAKGGLRALQGKGMPVGVAEAEDFDFIVKETSFNLETGSSLVLYTDGVTEAMNASRAQFGPKALENSLLTAPNHSADDVLASMLQAVQKHVGGQEASDDLTALVLRSS